MLAQTQHTQRNRQPTVVIAEARLEDGFGEKRTYEVRVEEVVDDGGYDKDEAENGHGVLPREREALVHVLSHLEPSLDGWVFLRMHIKNE